MTPRALLLDTHVLLWALDDSPRLGSVARREISGSQVFVSSASVWELAIKQSAGKIEMPDNLAQLIDDSGARLLDVSAAHALAVAQVETPHRDPFDRLLVAQCVTERLTLVTANAALLGLTDCPVIDARR